MICFKLTSPCMGWKALVMVEYIIFCFKRKYFYFIVFLISVASEELHSILHTEAKNHYLKVNKKKYRKKIWEKMEKREKKNIWPWKDHLKRIMILTKNKDICKLQNKFRVFDFFLLMYLVFMIMWMCRSSLFLSVCNILNSVYNHGLF